MHEKDPDSRCTGMFAKNSFHLLCFYRHVGHREPTHDDDYLRLQDYVRHAGLHANIIDMADLLGLVLVHQRNKNLLKFERAQSKAEELDKRCAGS